MSLRRAGLLLMKYWVSPPRKRRRGERDLAEFEGKVAVLVVEHDRDLGHCPLGERVPLPREDELFHPVPAQRAGPRPRPGRKRKASVMLLLPLPFGPTMPVMPGAELHLHLVRKGLEPDHLAALQVQGTGTPWGCSVAATHRFAVAWRRVVSSTAWLTGHLEELPGPADTTAAELEVAEVQEGRGIAGVGGEDGIEGPPGPLQVGRGPTRPGPRHCGLPRAGGLPPGRARRR